MLVVGIIVVAALLLSMGKSEAPPPPAPQPKPQPRGGDMGGLGGGTDFGKVAPAVAGTAGSLVTLGGTILAAVGAHGAGGAAVASGGTGAAVAGGTLAEAGGGTAELAAGGGSGAAAAESTLDAFAAVATGSAAAEAAVVGGIGVLVALAMLEMYMLEQVAGTRNYWARVSNKPQLYYSRWYGYEERAVQNYLDELSKARGGAQVAHTKQYADVLYGSDGSTVELHGYYVDSVQDTEALRDLPKVRAAARWFAIEREYHYHRAVLMFWGSIGRPPGVTDTGDVGDILAGTNAAQPAMLEEDFWKLAGSYLQTQPFAQVRYTTTQQVDAPLSKGGGVLVQGGASSYQPQGQLPQRDFESLTARARELLGAAYGAAEFQANLRGIAHGMTLGAVTGYQLLYPGDEQFTVEMGQRCGVLGTDFVFSPVRTSANEIRPVLLSPSRRYAIDVARSRFRSVPVLYGPSEIVS